MQTPQTPTELADAFRGRYHFGQGCTCPRDTTGAVLHDGRTCERAS
jgi:hypothetical protein